MTDTTHGATAPAALDAANKFHFIAWRWHFYAGLYVIPFLLMLATTGLIMLWIAVLSGVGDERMTVTPNGTPLAVSALQAAAEAAVPGGTAVQYVAPLTPGHVAAFAVADETGATTGVTLDPYSGQVLNTFPWRAGWYDLATDIHGTLLIGTTGDRLIEIAASLGILLAVSGVYLHWPRAGLRGLVPNLRARGRSLWKSLHGTLGLWLSGLMVVFLLSGLSWSGVWGERFVQAWSTYPAEKWDAVPLSDATHAEMNHGPAPEVPWGLEQTPMPASGSLAGTAAVAGMPDIDSIAAFANGLGFDGRFQVNLPADESGVWTISHDSMSNDGHDPAADRTIHIDQFTGNVLADVRYADYSAYARAMAWGVAFHEGDLGLWNVALNTLFCLSVMFLCISGAVMWLRRRPRGAGRLAAPARPQGGPFWWAAALVAVLLGLAFPLGGAVTLAVLVLDAVVARTLPGVKRALS